MSFNRVIIQGNITKDPDLRFLPSGTEVCGFTVAVNERWKDKSGEAKEIVSFIECSCFSATAKNIAQYFKRGSPILLEGKLRQESWEKDGQKRSTIKVIVDSFSFIGGKVDSGSERSTEPSRAKRMAPAPIPVDDDEPRF